MFAELLRLVISSMIGKERGFTRQRPQKPKYDDDGVYVYRIEGTDAAIIDVPGFGMLLSSENAASSFRSAEPKGREVRIYGLTNDLFTGSMREVIQRLLSERAG
ncbi:hypothetical protein [Infirmifilum sp.]|uniref:hypothetical protein n=1 Tax=Infirmifilum sp. TaxID=2856575 RepID=UPI003D0E0521